MTMSWTVNVLIIEIQYGAAFVSGIATCRYSFGYGAMTASKFPVSTVIDRIESADLRVKEGVIAHLEGAVRAAIGSFHCAEGEEAVMVTSGNVAWQFHRLVTPIVKAAVSIQSDGVTVAVCRLGMAFIGIPIGVKAIERG